MVKKLLLSLSLVVVMIMSSFTQVCASELVGNVYYDLTEDGEEALAKYGKNLQITSANISSQYKNKPVTRIGANAFLNCFNLESVTLPGTIKIIDNCAFELCVNLKEITLSSDLQKIGKEAFCGSGLNSIEIPDNVTSIDESAFEQCSDLSSVTIDNLGKIKSIGEYVFADCDNIANIDIKLASSDSQINQILDSLPDSVKSKTTDQLTVKVPAIFESAVRAKCPNAQIETYAETSYAISYEYGDGAVTVGENDLNAYMSYTSCDIEKCRLPRHENRGLYRKGFLLEGWYVKGDAAQTLITEEDLAGMTGDIILCPKWTPRTDISINVSIEAREGSNVWSDFAYENKLSATDFSVGELEPGSGYGAYMLEGNTALENFAIQKMKGLTGNDKNYLIDYWTIYTVEDGEEVHKKVSEIYLSDFRLLVKEYTPEGGAEGEKYAYMVMSVLDVEPHFKQVHRITYKLGEDCIKSTNFEQYETYITNKADECKLPPLDFSNAGEQGSAINSVYKKGYMLKGWYLDEELTIPIFEGSSDKPNAKCLAEQTTDLTLYPKWEPKNIKITYNNFYQIESCNYYYLNGNKSEGITISADDLPLDLTGEKMYALIDTINDKVIEGGDQFDCWSTDKDGNNRIDTLTLEDFEFNKVTVSGSESYILKNEINLFPRFKAASPKVKIKNYQFGIDGNINLTYYFDFSKLTGDEYAGARLITEANGQQKQVIDISALEDDGENRGKKIKLSYIARNIDDVMDIRFVDRDGKNLGFCDNAGYPLGNRYRISVEKCVEESESIPDAKYSALMKALLVYGRHADAFFNKKSVDSETGASLRTVTAEDVLSYKKSQLGAVAGVRYAGSSLILKSGTVIRHYFSITGDMPQIKINDKNITPVSVGDDLYYVDVVNVSPADYDKQFTVRIGEDDDYKLSYSVNSYVYDALTKSENDSLKKLVMALYRYGEAGKEYWQE